MRQDQIELRRRDDDGHSYRPSIHHPVFQKFTDLVHRRKEAGPGAETTFSVCLKTNKGTGQQSVDPKGELWRHVQMTGEYESKK